MPPGIHIRPQRNAALAALAHDLPQTVLASLLGVSIQTALFWARQVGHDWTTYLAARDEARGSSAQ